MQFFSFIYGDIDHHWWALPSRIAQSDSTLKKIFVRLAGTDVLAFAECFKVMSATAKCYLSSISCATVANACCCDVT